MCPPKKCNISNAAQYNAEHTTSRTRRKRKKQVAQLAQAFGMRVVAWNRSPINPLPPGIQIAPSLLSLAAQSDVVSVHAAAAPGGPLLAADFFEAIKEGGIVVNLSRGGVLDEQVSSTDMRMRTHIY
jgi:lactate dehydrogenase-like 2-hydroxyacid dehydrogenase